MTFRAGAAETVITPPVGTFLEGYGARTSGSVGVHDDLYARAIVVDDGTTQAAIVGCDLVGIDRGLAAAVRQLVHEATGMPGEHIMVSATHTHAGPAGLRADIDAELTDTTARLIASAVINAHGALRQATVRAGGGRVDTVSQNRRHPDWPIDDVLSVLLFESADPNDGVIGSIVNFACHATVLYHTNMHISADYPGHVVRTVKNALGDAPVVFLNGACGDVNPSWIEQTHDEAQRVGSIIGSEAARRLQELRPLGRQHKTWNIRWHELTDKAVTTGALIEPKISVVSEHVDVAMRQLPEPETYKERWAALERERVAAADDVEARRRVMEQMNMIGAERFLASRLRGDQVPRTLHPEVQAISFGPGCAVLGLPGEFFAESAHAIRAAASVPHLMIACYTNHHVFYVPPAHAFAEGGYEPGVAILDESAEATFREAAVGMLRPFGTTAA